MKYFQEIRTAGVVLAVVAAGFALGGSVSAAATGPEVAVAPSTGLADGEQVTVTGRGFPPGATVFVTECSGNSADTVRCEWRDDQRGTADGGGNVTVPATVHRSFEGYDPTGKPAGTVVCDVAPGCWIAAAGGGANAAPAPISFG